MCIQILVEVICILDFIIKKSITLKEIYFIRHGETEYNKQMIVQGGGVDSDLNQKGIQQGKAFYEYYKDVGFEVVLTSKLKRTHQTVASFIEQGLPWEQFAEIDEMNWGIHEGQKAAPWMRKNYTDMIDAWASGDYDHKIPEGESANELGKRVNAFLDMLKQRDESKILVCSHGRTMRCLVSQMEGKPLSAMEEHKHFNTGLTHAILKNDSFSLTKVNDLLHLQPS